MVADTREAETASRSGASLRSAVLVLVAVVIVAAG